MVREDKSTWKANYFTKLTSLLDEYPKCFIVGVDNVGSKQMQQIRQSLRQDATLLMGKNTMIRKAIRGYLEKKPRPGEAAPLHQDLSEVREKILDNKVQAPARAGALAPCDVKIPPQNTGLGPEKTSFFQALSIPTKISKGTIEILNEIHLIKKDDRVGASEATLLNMLNISPFTYGLVIRQVYDSGTVFEPEILDITPDDLRARFLEGVRNVAAVSLSIGYPTLASVPHSIVNGLKNLIAVALETDIDFEAAARAKEYVKDPSKFAAVAAAPAAAAGGSPKKEEKKKEESEEEEEDDDMGFGLFD
ncbi:60S acidic ribosomal protein P0 [Tyrophagus putrescentiae]|nr:60S acidic ribosomal protein P0 [Tyrophagus putrescentiae]